MITDFNKFYHEELVPYGSLVRTTDIEIYSGFYSEKLFRYNNSEYVVTMLNGEVRTIRSYPM